MHCASETKHAAQHAGRAAVLRMLPRAQEKCPLGINTGDLTKELRAEDMAASPGATRVARVRQLPLASSPSIPLQP